MCFVGNNNDLFGLFFAVCSVGGMMKPINSNGICPKHTKIIKMYWF